MACLLLTDRRPPITAAAALTAAADRIAPAWCHIVPTCRRSASVPTHTQPRHRFRTSHGMPCSAHLNHARSWRSNLHPGEVLGRTQLDGLIVGRRHRRNATQLSIAWLCTMPLPWSHARRCLPVVNGCTRPAYMNREEGPATVLPLLTAGGAVQSCVRPVCALMHGCSTINAGRLRPSS